MTKKFIAFDVDGVLLDNRLGGFKEILVFLGKKKEVLKIEREWQKRKLVSPWGLEQLAKLYKGITKEKLKELALDYCKKNLMKGAKFLLEKLKKKYYLGALSSNPQFIMNALKEILPLNFSEGTKLEFKEGKATGKIKRKVDRYIKAKILKEKIKKYKLKKKDVIVIGDSLTDLPMSKEAKVFIAFLPKEKEVENSANFVIKKKNLKEVLKYI